MTSGKWGWSCATCGFKSEHYESSIDCSEAAHLHLRAGDCWDLRIYQKNPIPGRGFLTTVK